MTSASRRKMLRVVLAPFVVGAVMSTLAVSTLTANSDGPVPDWGWECDWPEPPTGAECMSSQANCWCKAKDQGCWDGCDLQ
jgi:hypothetical protein